jgi:O-antigen ligase
MRLDQDATSRIPRAYLGAALFFALAGNIPPVAFEPSTSLVALTRGSGLTFAFGCLYLCLARERMADALRVLPYLLTFAVFLFYCALSAAWSLEPRTTIVRTAESGATILFSALWCYAAARLFQSDRQLCKLLARTIIAVTIYGVAMNVAIYGRPIMLAVNREESDRARFVLGGLHPLAVGDMLAIGALAVVMAEAKLWWKVGALLLMLPLLQLTDSTGARLLFAVLVLFYLNVRVLGSPHAAFWICLIWLAGLIAIGTFILVESAVVDRLAQDDRLLSMTGRSQLWQAIWQSGLASTWFGTGFDAARGAIQDVFGIPYQVHNEYLAVLVELGYVGAAIFTIVFLLWIAAVAASGSVVIWSIGLYVAAINMNNASMFTKTWMIFLTVMCLVNSYFPVGSFRPRAAAAHRGGTTPLPRPIGFRSSTSSRASAPRRRQAM